MSVWVVFPHKGAFPRPVSSRAFEFRPVSVTTAESDVLAASAIPAWRFVISACFIVHLFENASRISYSASATTIGLTARAEHLGVRGRVGEGVGGADVGIFYSTAVVSLFEHFGKEARGSTPSRLCVGFNTL